MNTIQRIQAFFTNPRKFWVSTIIKCSKFIPSDKLFLKLKWRASMGYKLDLKNPKSFNEKLQWLKLYDHNPKYTTMADKHSVKSLVDNVLGGGGVHDTDPWRVGLC